MHQIKEQRVIRRLSYRSKMTLEEWKLRHLLPSVLSNPKSKHLNQEGLENLIKNLMEGEDPTGWAGGGEDPEGIGPTLVDYPGEPHDPLAGLA